MTKAEILQAIIDNGYIDEIYEELRRFREERYRRVVHELRDSRATLKLIKKLSKDKVVQDILEESEEQ